MEICVIAWKLFDVQYSCRDTGRRLEGVIKICRHFWKLDMFLRASTVEPKIDLSRASQRWWCVAEIDHRQHLSIEISVFVRRPYEFEANTFLQLLLQPT